MINIGGYEVDVLDDEWTVITARWFPLGPIRAHARGHARRVRDLNSA